ncbi:MAG: DUF4157 domain-containing protein, partial [Merismopedia sp. SIO2A8]|nr:DUF4157 domain-containing protein [Merismopedia sp. SIO2A8]
MTATETRSTHSQVHRSADAATSTPERTAPFFSGQSADTSFFRGADYAVASNGSRPTLQAQSLGSQPPFFQDSHTTPPHTPFLQRKCVACGANEQQSPDIQPSPAFESDTDNDTRLSLQRQTLQRQPAFESDESNAVQGKFIQAKLIQAWAERSLNTPSQGVSPSTSQGLTAQTSASSTSSASHTQTPSLQAKLTIGQVGDRYEQEADRMADQVVSQSKTSTYPPTDSPSSTNAHANTNIHAKISSSPELQQTIQRLEQLLQKASSPSSGQTPGQTPTASSNIESRLQSAKGSGRPLESQTKADMESGFGADFSGVRIHTGSESASLNRSLGARAFTHGNDVFFNSGQYQPNTQSGKHLLAHELTHTVQQGASVQKQVQRQPQNQSQNQAQHPASISGGTISAGAISSTANEVQLLPDFITDELADYARHIPGYTLFTVIIGINPLTGRRVERNAMNLLEGLMGLVPFGTAIFDKLREHGILQDAFKWVSDELDRLDLSFERIERTVEAAWDDVEIIKGFDYNLRVLERHFGRLYDDVKSFAISLVDHLIDLLREAAIDIAEPLLADNKAWDLIKKVLHYDPLRDKPVEATTVEILEDFLILIGKETELEQMREQGTLKKTAEWLDTQIGTFFSLLGELGQLFTAAWDAIQPQNLPELPTNLRKLATQTFGFLQRVWDFAITVAAEVLRLIKEALLTWLSSFATDIPGYHLLTLMLGKDPFTQAVVPRTVTNIIRGFMSLVPGGERQFQRMSETGVIPRAAQRIEKMMANLGISWEFVQNLFIDIWNSFTIDDLLDPIGAFTRILETFKEPLNRLFTFVIEVIKVILELVLEMMNFPSDILANIINNAMQALDHIQHDP